MAAENIILHVYTHIRHTIHAHTHAQTQAHTHTHTHTHTQSHSHYMTVHAAPHAHKLKTIKLKAKVPSTLGTFGVVLSAPSSSLTDLLTHLHFRGSLYTA